MTGVVRRASCPPDSRGFPDSNQLGHRDLVGMRRSRHWQHEEIRGAVAPVRFVVKWRSRGPIRLVVHTTPMLCRTGRLVPKSKAAAVRGATSPVQRIPDIVPAAVAAAVGSVEKTQSFPIGSWRTRSVLQGGCGRARGEHAVFSIAVHGHRQPRHSPQRPRFCPCRPRTSGPHQPPKNRQKLLTEFSTHPGRFRRPTLSSPHSPPI